MKNADLARALEHIAPSHLAAEWDNVGRLMGSSTAVCARVLLAIDLTEAVLDEALRLNADALVLYHPPLFAPIKSLTDSTPRGAMLLRAAHAGLALHSPHTALDAADGGVNDFLCSLIGTGEVTPLRQAAIMDPLQSHRVSVHVPVASIDAVRTAMANSGAGVVGDYTSCSFAVEGDGTFLPGAASKPSVGVRGRLERVREARLEMTCAEPLLPGVISALRAAHPYEEPAYAIEPLEHRPVPRAGQGRLLRMRRYLSSRQIAMLLRKGLGITRMELVGAPSARHDTVGVCAGSGAELAEDALALGATLFITGEMKHHERLALAARDMSCLLCGHTETERPYLKVLKRRLERLLPGLSVSVSRADRPPSKHL